MEPSRVFADGLLDGQVAIVTGGGTNLGKAAAAELVRCGASVMIAGRREDVLEVAADEIGCSYVVGDVRDGDQAAVIVQAALDRHGRLDLLPNPGDYRHHRGGEDNGDAHLKNLLVHHQVIVPITDARLDLGPWQQIFYCEFDGRRRKRLVIKVLGE